MHSATYSYLDKHQSADWFCRCFTSRNSSSLYHSYMLPVSNSFSVLNHIQGDESFCHSAPVAQSSPIGTNCTTSQQHVDSSEAIRPQHPNLFSRHSMSSSAFSCTNSSSQRQPTVPTKDNNWRTLIFNINGTRSKVACLENLFESTKPDAVILNETKLDNSILTSEVAPSDWGYTTYRLDRNSGGGGVMLLVKDDYISQEVPWTRNSGEIIWVEVLLKNKQKLYISSFYRPPSRSAAQLELFEESLCDIAGRCKNNPNHTINIGGDFNARDVNWDSICVVSGSSQKDVNDMLLRILGDFNLTQTVREPTRHSSILDLFITTTQAYTSPHM